MDADLEIDPQSALLAAVRAGTFTIVDMLDTFKWFQSGADWTAWRSFLCALYALPMTDREYDIYVACTGRKDIPTQRASEVYVPTGRRGRKSAIGSLIAVERSLQDYTGSVAPGQQAVIPILADKKGNAQTIMQFVTGIMKGPILSGLIDGVPGAESLSLTTGVTIKVKPARITAGRSIAIPCAILDEAAFFPTDDSAQPDLEIVNGIKPAMATFPDPLLVVLSSPYAKRGILWQAWRDYYGQPGRILVWQAPTLAMHDTPTVRAFVQGEIDKDPVSAAAEYGAIFRTDISNPFDESVLQDCTDKGVSERPFVPGNAYAAFVDASGGSIDSFTLAIAHWDGAFAVLDHVEEWPAPYRPREVVMAATSVLKRYQLRTVEGDHYGGDWPAERFTDGLHDETDCPRAFAEASACTCVPWKVAYGLSDRNKSELYLQLIPVMADRRVRLLDHARTRVQMAALERRTARGGHDSIDHPPNGKDDVANAVAGVLVRVDATKIGPKSYHAPPTNPVELRRDQINDALQRRLKEAMKRSRGGPRGGRGDAGL